MNTLIHKASAEFLGTLCFQLVGSITGTYWSNGILLTLIAYYFSKASGAHVNPAVSITFCTLGHINLIELVVYVTSQFAGAIIGSMMTLMLIPGNTWNDVNAIGSGCVVPAVGMTNAHIFAWELLATMFFIMPIMSVVWYTNAKNGYGNTGPLIIGLSLITQAYLASGYTGGSLNPARLLASEVIYDCSAFNKYGFYVLGQVVGSLMAAAFVVPYFGINPTAWYLKGSESTPDTVWYIKEKAIANIA